MESAGKNICAHLSTKKGWMIICTLSDLEYCRQVASAHQAMIFDNKNGHQSEII